MTIPLTPQISLSPSSYSASGQTITASVSVLNRPAYHGKPAITGLTSITPKMICSRSPSGVIPFHIQVSASETTCNAGNAYRDLHYEWDFGDSSGTEAFTDHFNSKTVNANNAQEGPEAAYLYRNPGTYTVTLTVTGKDENGTIITASTTTIRTIGIHYYFLASATGGSYTLTYNGETTSAIAYNATSATVQAALEALASLNNTNVFCLKGSNTVQFVGAITGETYTFTGDFSGLTGTNGTPRLATQMSSSSSLAVTVSDMSGLASNYFDPSYDTGLGASDGTIAKPWTTAAQLATWIRGGSNRVSYLKRGTTLVMSADINWQVYTRHRILPYGSGAKPIITSTTYKFVVATLSSATNMGDIVFSNISFIQSQANGSTGLFFAYSTTNGAPTAPYSTLENFLLDSCDYVNTKATAGHSYYINWQVLNDSFQNRGLGSSGLCIWGGSINMGIASGHAIYAQLTQYFAVVGTSIYGGDGDLILDHHIYPTVRCHSLYRYIQFGPTGSKNYCINTNALHLWGRHANFLIDGCDITGTCNAIDASNSSNSYSGGADGHLDDIVIRMNKIHCGSVGVQKYGFLANNVFNVVIAHNDFWGNSQGNIVSSDTTKPTMYTIYCNRFYAGGIIVAANQQAYLHDNSFYATSTSISQGAIIHFSSSSTNVEQWDCEGNTYYAPGLTQPFYNVTTAAFVSLSGWRAWGNDILGSIANPSWYDPANGKFIASPSIAVQWPAAFAVTEVSTDDGENWSNYTNGSDAPIGEYITDHTTVLFRANTNSGGTVTIIGNSDASNIDATSESFSAVLTSSINTLWYFISAGGITYTIATE